MKIHFVNGWLFQNITRLDAVFFHLVDELFQRVKLGFAAEF